MAEMSAQRRRQLRSDVTGSSRFWVQLQQEEVIGLLDDVDRLEAELRLAREVNERIGERVSEYASGWMTAHAALSAIRREVEGRDG